MTTCTRSAVSMLTDFFSSDDIEAAARRTGFVKRASKLTGKLFLALVTFGSWSDATTMLAQLAAKGRTGCKFWQSLEALEVVEENCDPRGPGIRSARASKRGDHPHSCARLWLGVPTPFSQRTALV
jgi:hypothetical protein